MCLKVSCTQFSIICCSTAFFHFSGSLIWQDVSVDLSYEIKSNYMHSSLNR